MTDRARLFAACFIRATSTGLVGVLLGVALPAFHVPGGAMGVIVSLGLGGMTLYMLAATLRADRFGRRRALVALTLVSTLGGLGFALGESSWLLGAAALVGAVNGMGRDRGAALVLEQAMLPATVSDAERTRFFAYYNVTQDAGHAIGSLLAGTPALLVATTALDHDEAIHITFALYAALCLGPLPLYAGLSNAVEARVGIEAATTDAPVRPATKRVVWRISTLFALDSLGGGFLTATFVAYFFQQQFGVGEAVLAPLFAAARVLNALSHLGAAWLAARIGLVRTMVFTHLPSSVLLLTVPFMPTFEIAAVLFLLREGLVEMDVPTRQSYVMALVAPHERTYASGTTNLVRTGAWAVAPSVAGALTEAVALGVPLYAGASLKILYDVLLWSRFREVRPPEEA